MHIKQAPNEKYFARLQFELRVSGHGGQENLRTFNLATKGGDKCEEKISSGTEDEPDELGIEKKNSGGDNPGDGRGDSRVCEFTHLGTVARN